MFLQDASEFLATLRGYPDINDDRFFLMLARSKSHTIL